MAQAQQVFDDRRVVVGGQCFDALVRGAGAPGAIKRAAQPLGARIGDDGYIGGLIEPQQPTFLARLDSPLTRLRDDAGIESVELGRVAEAEAERIGGVEHVFFEARAQVGEFEHDRFKALLLRTVECDTRQTEVEQHVFDQGLLGGAERGRLACHDGLESFVQRLALADLGAVVGQQRQAGVVGLAQRLGIEHAIEVTDGRPAARQLVADVFEQLDHRGEGGVGQLLDPADGVAVGREQRADSRLGMFRLDSLKGRQMGSAEQRIFCSHS